MKENPANSAASPVIPIPEALMKSIPAGEGELFRIAEGDESWLNTMLEVGETSLDFVLRSHIDWVSEYDMALLCPRPFILGTSEDFE